MPRYRATRPVPSVAFEKAPQNFLIALASANIVRDKSKFETQTKSAILSDGAKKLFAVFLCFDKLDSLVERRVVICELNYCGMGIHIGERIL